MQLFLILLLFLIFQGFGVLDKEISKSFISQRCKNVRGLGLILYKGLIHNKREKIQTLATIPRLWNLTVGVGSITMNLTDLLSISSTLYEQLLSKYSCANKLQS